MDSGLITQGEYRITTLTKGSEGRIYTSPKAHNLNADHELRHTHLWNVARKKIHET